MSEISEHYQQLELPLDVKTLPKFSTTYDISWDKPDTYVPPHTSKCVREQVDFDTNLGKLSNERDKTLSEALSPQHNQSVREQLFDKSAPEHKPLVNQWVEEYWVRRSGTEYYYYRFCWMDGRKIRHKHIGGGNSSSPTATYRKLIVEASLDTATTDEVVALIDSFKNAT